MPYEKLTHIDLFSGIGGFALAADRVFPDIQHVFCDNEPFPQEVLKKHWPEALHFGDIRTLTYASFTDARRKLRAIHNANGEQERPEKQGQETTRQSGSSDKSPVFILTGGFPCQPFSQAGRRRGEEERERIFGEDGRPKCDRKICGSRVYRGKRSCSGTLKFQDGPSFDCSCACHAAPKEEGK